MWKKIREVVVVTTALVAAAFAALLAEEFAKAVRELASADDEHPSGDA